MFNRNMLLLLSILLISSPADAKQPISESLVDCAAIFTISTRAFPERQTGKTAALKKAAQTLTTEAHDRAVSEGRSNPKKYVAKLVKEKQQKWDTRGVAFIFTEEFRDWASYCHSLSKHLDIDLVQN